MADIIDINVTETTEQVTINVVNDVIQVNINQVTGGGGGSQSLAQTLVNGNITDGEDISISDGDKIVLDNGSKLVKGTTDAGNGGNKGIALRCSVDYELKWEAGRLYVMEQDGFTIREVSYNFTDTPTTADDDTKGFVIGSRWVLDNGDVYVCTDATTASAVWELQGGGGGSQDIDQVLAEGNVATDKNIFFNYTDVSETLIDGSGVTVVDGVSGDSSGYQGGRLYTTNSLAGKELNQRGEGWEYNEGAEKVKVEFETPTGTTGKLLFPDVVNATKTVATLDDIPSVTGFVPYTGANADVNLGEFGLLTGNIEFDNTPTNIPTTAGSMYYNDADGTVDLILKGGNVKLQIGQESVIRVVNKTATNINLLEANYQAVRVTGAQGQRLKVDLAQATTDTLSAETIGLVTETINNNQEGFITTSGLVRNINTTGSLQGETWADGDILYLSPTTAGRITKVKPSAPNHLVIIGYVVHAHATQGSIFVKVDNGYELDELHNVKITTATNNQALIYTSATDIWENKTIIQDSITDGVTTVAPSQNAVFDALVLKQDTLTETNFGAFANSLTAKNTLVDADEVVSDDSADSNKAKKTSWLNVWTNYIKPKADALYLKIASNGSDINNIATFRANLGFTYLPYKFLQTSQTAHTGTTAETIIATATINGGTFNANDVMKMLYRISKPSGTAGGAFQIRINTTNTLSGSVVIFAGSFNNTTRQGLIERTFDLQGGNLYGFNFTNSTSTDVVIGTTALSNTPYNTANTLFVFFTIQLSNSADSVTPNLCNITN